MTQRLLKTLWLVREMVTNLLRSIEEGEGDTRLHNKNAKRRIFYTHKNLLLTTCYLLQNNTHQNYMDNGYSYNHVNTKLLTSMFWSWIHICSHLWLFHIMKSSIINRYCFLFCCYEKLLLAGAHTLILCFYLVLNRIFGSLVVFELLLLAIINPLWTQS